MKKILYFAVLFLLPMIAIAQNKKGKGNERLLLPETPRRYYTQKNHQRLLSLDKEMALRRAFLEMNIRNSSLADLPKEVNIPVVVHIIYQKDIKAKDLPKDNEVQQQIDILSKDFRQTTKQEKHEADKKEKFSDKNALDTKISFCLAAKDPNGKATTGIISVPTSVTTWGADDKMKSASTGGSTAWDTEKYLNIWVVNLPDSISGYAQMPAGPAATDGIVIDTRYFGKKNAKDKVDFPYTEGETLTHLVGSYLNLYELWSETMPCGDDGVEDTPIQNAPSLGCVDYRHVSTCGDNPVAMTMNYMDNSNDLCQYMFTNGQKKRMIACLVGGGVRYKLGLSGETQCGKKGNVVETVASRNGDEANEIAAMPSLAYRVYPNPAQDNIYVEITTNTATTAIVTLFNAQGKLQKQFNYAVGDGVERFTIKCNDWSSGLYFVQLEVNGEVKTAKVVIER